jgi:1-acyl-sn-glycerol-3-phosphate acyltransferase
MRPAQGLVVSNHLSYLDILVYAAAMPCVFVAKREVRDWPAFGFFARCGGTVFIDRQSRASTDDAARQIDEALQAGVVVMVFPEGTSTDGSEVFRFHPSLLEPAVQLGVDMTPAAIAYRVQGGEERDVCYYGDVHFVPHLLQTLGRPEVAADVEFFPERGAYAERKTAAVGLRDRVQAMRQRIRRTSGT